MDKVHFLFGVHNHQPIGNFDFVFEKAYSRAYLPFLEAMERHPRLGWNLHATGILWEWLEQRHPDYVQRISEQVHQGRLEILTGGYYEPILPSLPDVDKAGQIQKLTRYIQRRFKVTPQGMWLAERVWEPSLPKTLHENGISYTLVDDTHFLSAGMTEEELAGPYLTEDQGVTLTLLPIRKALRYAIPFKEPGETLNALRRYVTPAAGRALVMIDDGEKFGLWPDTFDHVYKNGWLDRFLTVLESNSDWIICSRISDYLAQTAPHGRVYLPTVAYFEMGEWTLPSPAQQSFQELTKALPGERLEEAKRFVRGGFWRNFFTKYEESNNLHKKMLAVSKKVYRAIAESSSAPLRVSARAQKMLDALWAGQCNCAYWHGVFGGLYLPHLRQAIYRELMQAESLADKTLGAPELLVSQNDFDDDGQREILVESNTQNVYFSPHSGGSMFEWDLRNQGINLLNVLTRRQEGYHKQLLEFQANGGAPYDGGGVRTIHERVRLKEPGLEKRLHVDWYRRANLLDHFFHPDTTLQHFYACQYGEQGDFVKNGYHVSLLPQIRLSRLGSVWTGQQVNRILVEKTFSLLDPLGWEVRYRIQNEEGAVVPLWFGSEMNFAFCLPEPPDPVEHMQQTQWQHQDQGFGLTVQVQFDAPIDLWEFPLETVSLSEEGFERTYQGTVLLAHWRCTLEPGQEIFRSWRVEVRPA
jgi:alpha-amylase